MKKKISQYKYILLLFIVFIPQLFILGKGALSISDENRYIQIYDGFLGLVEKLDISYLFSKIIINAAIPGNQLLSLIPVSIQYVIEQIFGINHLHPDSLIIPQIFNWIILFLTAILIFKLQNLFCNNKRLSFLVAFIFLSLVNTNIYLRHMLPYGLGVFFGLLAIYYTSITLRDGTISKLKLFKIGLLSSFSFSMYAGYFFTPLFTFLLVIFLCSSSIKNIKNIVVIFVFYGIGFFILIFIYEIIGQLAGTSHIMSLIHHSDTITQGDYSEGFIFPINYLVGIESFIGVLLLVFSIIGILSLIIDTFFRRKKLTVYSFVLLIAIFCYLSFSIQCFYFEKMVWYGRIFHFFCFFIISLAIYTIYRYVKNKVLINCIILIFFGVSLISFVLFIKEYNVIAYPIDVIVKEKINMSKGIDNNKLFSINWNDTPYTWNGAPYLSLNYLDSLVLVNSGFLWSTTDNVKKIKKIIVNDSIQLIYEYFHYAAYEPYLYEGYNKKDRIVMKIANPKIQIFTKKIIN